MAKETRKRTAAIWRISLVVSVLIVAGLSSAMAGLKVREFALNDSRFLFSSDQAGALEVAGLQYTSRAKVRRIFAADFGNSVFAVPLDERRRRLLAIDWVEDASVSRIWPDRVLVRLQERKPVAFVYGRSAVMLIDAMGVLLELPPQTRFAFPVLRGIREEEQETHRRERVRTFLDFEQDMGALAKDVSEVDVSDLANLRIVARVENRALELTMGDGNFARRYRNFLTHYPEIRKGSPQATAFDLRLDTRIAATDTRIAATDTRIAAKGKE